MCEKHQRREMILIQDLKDLCLSLRKEMERVKENEQKQEPKKKEKSLLNWIRVKMNCKHK